MNRTLLVPALALGLFLSSGAQAALAIHEVDVSGEVDEAPLDETLRLIFRELGVPFVLIEDDVPEAAVSFSLEGVPLDEVLNTLLPPHGLRWEIAGDVVLVRATESPEVRALREEVNALRASVEALAQAAPSPAGLADTVTMIPGADRTLGEVTVTLLGINGDTAQLMLAAPERSNFSPILEIGLGQRQIEHGVFLEVLDLDEAMQYARLRIEVPDPLTEEDWPAMFL